MGRVFGIVLIVLGVWASVEIYSEGTEHAFGGVFANGRHGPPVPLEQSTLPDAVRERMNAAMEQSRRRTQRFE